MCKGYVLGKGIVQEGTWAGRRIGRFWRELSSWRELDFTLAGGLNVIRGGVYFCQSFTGKLVYAVGLE